ncbi:MAG TPA: hypothetical protein VIV60_19510 [Polyangiaceae bacterium]
MTDAAAGVTPTEDNSVVSPVEAGQVLLNAVQTLQATKQLRARAENAWTLAQRDFVSALSARDAAKRELEKL